MLRFLSFLIIYSSLTEDWLRFLSTVSVIKGQLITHFGHEDPLTDTVTSVDLVTKSFVGSLVSDTQGYTDAISMDRLWVFFTE